MQRVSAWTHRCWSERRHDEHDDGHRKAILRLKRYTATGYRFVCNADENTRRQRRCWSRLLSGQDLRWLHAKLDANIVLALTPDHMRASMTSTILCSQITSLVRLCSMPQGNTGEFELKHLDALAVPMWWYLWALIGNLHARSQIDRSLSGASTIQETWHLLLPMMRMAVPETSPCYDPHDGHPQWRLVLSYHWFRGVPGRPPTRWPRQSTQTASDIHIVPGAQTFLSARQRLAQWMWKVLQSQVQVNWAGTRSLT